jgi:hypothetical protein
VKKTYFTIDEANRTLPLVRKIVQDIVDDYRRWKEALARYELAAAYQRSESGESDEAMTRRREVDDLAERINGYIAELEQVGCVLKGFDEGLVDFRGRLEQREVWLCWRLGESEVSHWHELDAGFQARQPIVPAHAEEGSDR